MKRVLYIVPGLNPLIKDGASNRVNSFAKCFLQGGYRVNILALCHIRQFPNLYRNRKALDQSYHWILIPYVFFGNHKISLIMYLYLKPLIMLIALLYRCKTVLADYAHGGVMSSWTRLFADLIVNYRGDSIDEMKLSLNYGDNSSYIKCYQNYVRQSAKFADYSICVSKNLQKLIEEQANSQLENCFIFPCCADINRFLNIEKTSNKDIVIGYFGSLSKWQCIDEVIDAFSRLRKIDDRYKLLILTASDIAPFKEKLDNIGNYEVISVPFPEMPNYIAKMDVSIALRHNRSLNIVSSPTKLSESLASGVPVIVTKYSGDYAEIIKHNKTGYVLNSEILSDDDILAIHDYCVCLKQDKEAVAEKCRNAVKDRTWNNYAKAFIDFLNK